jgi:uncharacterized integral membrane protein
MVIVTLILALVLAIIAAIFAIQNPAPVEVNFLTWTPLVDGSLALVLMIAYGIGVVTGILLMLPGAIKSRAQIMVEKRKTKKAESKDTPQPYSDNTSE